MTRNRYPIDCSGRRARRAQWLRDAAALYAVHLRALYDGVPYVERAAAVLRAESAAKRTGASS
jgi:hypothetical protein